MRRFCFGVGATAGLLLTMDVQMISRHRQWRAWQFGVRHSGMWRNSGGASGGNDDDEPKWVGLVTYATWTAAMWWMFGWVAGVTLVVIGAAVLAIRYFGKL